MSHIETLLTVETLQAIFRDTFFDSYNTELIGGADEPLYQPATEQYPHHRLYFREDYISSAFHEIAHWCIAGEARRQLLDFGYWYQPDGRSAEQQRTFESVEVKPQAVEWHLSEAAGHRFHLSADNLSGESIDEEAGSSERFAEAVIKQAQDYCQQGLPPRAKMLADALRNFFGSGETSLPDRYIGERL
ncbi:elongation factor P hydroxylase [Porticoccaceae bacterium LTM1]|nr:elongation factor P hydroxylase [Porticoccaceae bacterium LTM1]